jgi:hypothetical protein
VELRLPGDEGERLGCAFSIFLHPETAPVFAVWGRAATGSSPVRSATGPHGPYNAGRTHTRLRDAPGSLPREPRPSPDTKVVGLPRIGGLHHRYAWREAV